MENSYDTDIGSSPMSLTYSFSSFLFLLDLLFLGHFVHDLFDCYCSVNNLEFYC